MIRRATVSVVIPTCNRLPFLFSLLDSLASQRDSPLYEMQVIVSDDGIRDDTSQIPQRYPWVRYVRGPRRGPASNRNNGAKYATGDLLIFLDDDCVASETLVSSYVNKMNDSPGISVFEGRISAIGYRKSYAEQCPVNEAGGYLWSCNFAIPRSIFVELRGFDERFQFAVMEDVDLRERLLAQNTSIIFVPDAQVFHAWETRTGWRRLRHGMLSYLVYLQLHPDKAHKTPSYFLHSSTRELIRNGILSWNVYRFKGISQLALATINAWRMAAFTRFPALCRWYIRAAKPCCAGCQSSLCFLRQAPDD
jgi:GT2 family glycosyltransferase